MSKQLCSGISINGELCNDLSEFVKKAVNFYSRLFNEDQKCSFFRIVCKSLIMEYDHDLLNDFIESCETKAAIESMKDYVTPRQVGFNTKFYKIQ